MSERKDFELLNPLPLGVQWSEKQQDYTFESYRTLQSATSYSLRWKAYQQGRRSAQADNEALRARVAELEDFVADTAIACQRSLDPDWVPDGVQDALVPLSKRCCALLGDDPDEHESAWLLRKQAEAVDWVWHNYCRESALEDCKALYQEDMEGAVDALRQQAAELERQSEGGE